VNDLRDRILDISYKHKLSHIGSCLTTLPILDFIYSNKNEEDDVVLSNGHAGLAQYVIIEKHYGHDAEQMLLDWGIHPCRDTNRKTSVSTGSLGCGIAIATGMALANRNKNTHCIISDGECAEGIVWESLSFAYKNKLTNLKIYLNMNGYSAYDKVDEQYLENRIKAFFPTVNIWKTNSDLIFATGIESHYKTMNENEYKEFKNATRIK
jgi:transketolase